jgi:RNA polymerase sigma-70 factor (ECF subfamily)
VSTKRANEETRSAPADDEDAPWVERFVAGERAAFDELMRRHERSVYFLAMRYLRDHDEAADILQRTFLKAFEKLAEFEGRSQFRTWLFRIAINLCKNRLRDQGRWQKVDPEEDELLVAPAKEDHIEAEQKQAALSDAVDRLPPKQRQTLELRVFGEMSFREIAEAMGCTENAAKVNYHYAVKNLLKIQGQSS